ncbi:hypothetical protein [Rhodoferax sediminis]|jgi:hypothetical protein|uniref:Uncharacterized protein n=1 Tax=Rhodoferax sediminis TaxID=2509614 RepID=A0A515D8A7_9BURK|nr:hypothetical protein [Rhodoferax sediminis]QDL36638.1 hypothetical protein EUB48_04515 [Rhodoferax sediminis]
MNKQEIAVKVKTEAGGALVIETRDGSEQTYCLNQHRTMYLHVRQLHVSREVNLFRFGDDDLGLAPEMSLLVRGTATLEDRSISIIGDPDSKVRTLGIDFYVLDEDLRRKRMELAQKHGQAPRYPCARLGFVRHSRGIGIDDDWFIQCQVPPATLRAISSAASCGTMGVMSVGLALRRIYSSEARASQSVKADWYLRPNRRDNTVDAPEMAYGDITLLSFEEALAHSSLEAVPQRYAFDDTIPAPMLA